MGLKINEKYYTIVEFQHVKPGKGGAFVRYKIRDLKTGRVIDQTCNAGTKFENVQLITKEMQYLYNDGGTYYFMDNETYEQVELPADFIGDNAKLARDAFKLAKGKASAIIFTDIFTHHPVHNFTTTSSARLSALS